VEWEEREGVGWEWAALGFGDYLDAGLPVAKSAPNPYTTRWTQIGLGAQDINGIQRIFQNKKWLALQFLTSSPMSTAFYVNMSTLTYLTDPLKTLAFALFWPQIPPQNHLDSLTQQQRGKFWTQDHAIQRHLGCSDLISGLRTGVEAILTKSCVTKKSNWIYASCFKKHKSNCKFEKVLFFSIIL
jgi:hypothetical protein